MEGKKEAGRRQKKKRLGSCLLAVTPEMNITLFPPLPPAQEGLVLPPTQSAPRSATRETVWADRTKKVSTQDKGVTFGGGSEDLGKLRSKEEAGSGVKGINESLGL